MSKEVQQESLVISELGASTGKIGLLKLNSEKKLNSLTLSMVEAMSTQLSTWEENDDIAVIVLMGAGDKAFCAGADIQELYQSAILSPGGPCVEGEAFFQKEYQLNYQIHTYAKPIICLGNGIVMGGGLGLMAGASHRVATESSYIAMPEITIGLFPDVGATYFLNQIPYNLGVFFGLTGASINARDAIYTRLADYVMPWSAHTELLNNLQNLDWQLSDPQKNHLLVDEQLHALAFDDKAIAKLMPSKIQMHHAFLEKICLHKSLAEVLHEIYQYEEDDPWFNKAKLAVAHGSPLASVLIYEQLRRHRHTNLEEAFYSEFQLATNVIRHPEFSEGVRALLIDKDKSPEWQFKHFSEVSCTLLEHFFSAPWTKNPLEIR